MSCRLGETSGEPFAAAVERIDLLGIVGFAIATAALMGFLFLLPHASCLMLLAGILTAVGLFTHERRAWPAGSPICVSWSRTGRSPVRICAWGMTTFCVNTIIYGFAQWLQAARNVPAREAGLLLLPMTLISIGITLIISPRNLIRGPLIAAASASLVGSIGVVLTVSGLSRMLLLLASWSVIRRWWGNLLGGANGLPFMLRSAAWPARSKNRDA